MANTDNAFGAKLWSGDDYTIERWQLPSTHAALGKGDWINQDDAGRVNRSAVNTNLLGLGLSYEDTDGNNVLTNGGGLATNVGGYVYVLIPTRHTKFIMQASSAWDGNGSGDASIVSAETHIGNNVDIDTIADFDTATGISTMELAEPAADASATAQLMIRGLAYAGGGHVPSTNAFGLHSILIVTVNEHFMSSVTGTS